MKRPNARLRRRVRRNRERNIRTWRESKLTGWQKFVHQLVAVQPISPEAARIFTLKAYCA